MGAVGGGRARDDGDHARVVLRGVMELDSADERIRAQRGRDGQRAATAQVPVTRHGSRSADGVVEREPRAEVSALPTAPAERPQERHGRDEVRSDARQHQLALAQRLADEADVAHLEVAQAPVDELARGARGPRREVPRLDQADPQAARGRVERGARTR